MTSGLGEDEYETIYRERDKVGQPWEGMKPGIWKWVGRNCHQGEDEAAQEGCRAAVILRKTISLRFSTNQNKVRHQLILISKLDLHKTFGVEPPQLPIYL